MRARVCVESLILAALCLADMISTLLCVLSGKATEQNPLMAACLGHSPELFVLVKMASFVPFIVVVELYRRRNPAFATAASRAAIILYVVAYAVITAGVNLT
jgi:hypothetical protein